MKSVELASAPAGQREEPGLAPSLARLQRRNLALFWALALTVVALDQLVKFWVRATFALGEGQDVLPGWLHWTHVRNQGAAWGMMAGQRFFLIAITLGVLVAVTIIAREIAARGVLASCGLGLILGGAVGNLIDRVWLGAVTDFIDLDTPLAWLQTFPVFNLADSALTVGVVLLLIDLLLCGERPGKAN
jgi:signal peptidase II